MAAEKRQKIIENRHKNWKNIAVWDHLVQGQTVLHTSTVPGASLVKGHNLFYKAFHPNKF